MNQAAPSDFLEPPDCSFDEKRLAALDGYSILDTPAEQGFDDIVYLAAQICETPVSLVSFVANNRQWFKARIGFEPCETDLSSSVCAHALIEPDLLVIGDLSLDPRTKRNPLVTREPHIRFYAGAPLRAATGEVLGSLCVIDGKPRPQGLTPPQAEGLRSLARQVMSQMELRRALAERDSFFAFSRRAELRRSGLLALGDRLRGVDNIPQMASGAAAVVCKTLGLIRAGFGRIDGTGEFVDIEQDWAADGYASVQGRYRLNDSGSFRAMLSSAEPVVIEDITTDPKTADGLQALMRLGVRSLAILPVRDHNGIVAIFFAHDANPRKWEQEDLTFLLNVGERVAASVARVEAERLQKVLNLELSHRMKNTFAMVQALATQTLRVVPDQTPVDIFLKRLQALSTAHEALLHQSWQSAKMSDIVANVLGHLGGLDRFKIDGSPVNVGSRAALSLSLLLHELATNALKYGALSKPTGRVAVTWQVKDDELNLHWRETGGPPAAEPTRRGFGSRLIKMGLIGTGGVALRYLPTGFEADFTASLSQVQQP